MKGEVGPRPPDAPSSAGGLPQAIVTLGAAAGGVLGGWLVDHAGRKLSLLLCTVPFVTGFAIITAAQDVWMLLGGRLLTGLACGIASLVAPVSVPQPGALGPRRRSRPGGVVIPSGCPLSALISLTLARKEGATDTSPVADEVRFRRVKSFVQAQLVRQWGSYYSNSGLCH